MYIYMYIYIYVYINMYKYIFNFYTYIICINLLYPIMQCNEVQNFNEPEYNGCSRETLPINVACLLDNMGYELYIYTNVVRKIHFRLIQKKLKKWDNHKNNYS